MRTIEVPTKLFEVVLQATSLHLSAATEGPAVGLMQSEQHIPMFLPVRPCLHTPLTARNLIRLLKFHNSIYTTGDRLWARRLWLHGQQLSLLPLSLHFSNKISAPTKSPPGQKARASWKTSPLQILFSGALKEISFCQCET